MKSNEDVARALDEIGDLLEMDGANQFRVRAYRRAAKTVRELAEPVVQAVQKKLPGIGADLAGKIDELARTGTTEVLDDVRERWPEGLRAVLQVQGLGPKRVKILHEELGVSSVDDLKRVVDQGLLRSLPQLGASLETKLKKALTLAPTVGDGRFPLATVVPIAEELVARVRALPGVTQVDAAGSLRRRKATVGDLDIVACAADGRAVIDAFTKFPTVHSILAAGDTRGSVKLQIGLQVDLRVVAHESYGAALLYLTGSKNHSIELRAAAIKLGFKLNEYGVFDGDKKLAGETEASMYAALGMTFLPPEQRER